MANSAKPKLLFLRFTRPDLPSFVKYFLQEQVVCLSQHFDVVAIDDLVCDYNQLCDTHEPDISLFETGISVAPSEVRNVNSHPSVPKVAYINCDAYCPTRKVAIRDMARWGISTVFANAISLGSYTPLLADQLFAWPNFVNPQIYRDYGNPKVIPVLFSGSHSPHYPWRRRIDRVVSQQYPSLHSPYSWKKGKRKALTLLEGEKYAQLLNSSWVAPACGTIANDLVRKHFEIPACNSCLLTEKTAALEAAGFVDLVNCVFADETNVIDKLEWLFENPESLIRISHAGHELVNSQHTMRQRDQILQWYTLNKNLKPGQRIVQRGPFQPLTTVDVNSRIDNGHIESRGTDRLLMNEGDHFLRLGNLQEAENRYRKASSYFFYPEIPEAKFRLVYCLLCKGNGRAALEIVRQHFSTQLTNGNQNWEPDPTEWAWFILAMLCCGKKSEALFRAEQFPDVNSVELHRVRCVVEALCGAKLAPCHNDGKPLRVSVHQPFGWGCDEWLANVRRMLDAFQIGQSTRLLAGTEESLHAFELEANSPPARDSRTGLIQEKGIKRHAVKRIVLSRFFAAANQADRITKKIKFRTARLTKRFARYAADFSEPVDDCEWDTVIRLVQKEDVRHALLAGAASGSWLSNAFMRGILSNTSLPSVACANFNTRSFRKFHRRFAGSANVEFRYVPDHGRELPWPPADLDVIAVNCHENVAGLLRIPMKANLVLLEGIDSPVGSGFLQSLLSDGKYVLADYESSRRVGYAVLQKSLAGAAHGINWCALVA